MCALDSNTDYAILNQGHTMKSRTLMLAGVVTLVACAPNVRTQAAAGQDQVQCHYATEDTVARLFARWNTALMNKDMTAILATYADRSILLPTLSDTLRISRAEKRRYFEHFFKKTPSGKIETTFLVRGCNSAVAAGLYTFTFKTPSGTTQARYTYTYEWTGRDWLITSHHSSQMPGEH
jgi:uncharacterized protein (TIGR02246 family)